MFPFNVRSELAAGGRWPRSYTTRPRLLSERPPPDRLLSGRLLSGHLLLERLAGDAVLDLVDLARMQLNGGAETGITERIGSS